MFNLRFKFSEEDNSSFRAVPVVIQLSEKGEPVPKRIQLLKTGTFYQNGKKLNIEKKHLDSMVKNFSENARGIDLMLDFSHDTEGPAAGWFKNVAIENGNELWAEVEWTSEGIESVKDKKYRYISADFHFNYKNNETLQEYGPTLFGAGLTNRPVVKGMKPVILSEENEDEKKKLDNQKTKESDMTPEQIEEMKKENAKLKEDNKNLKDNAENKKLSEQNEKLAEENKKLKEDKEKQDKENAFNKMLSEGKACEAQREAYLSGDMQKFAENAQQLNAGGKPAGHSGNDGKSGSGKKTDSDTPAQDEVLKLAEEKMKADKSLGMDDAISTVLSENAELNKKYEEEVGN